MEFNSDFLKAIPQESYVNPKVEKRQAGEKGAGLFAKQPISKGEIVSISGGVILHKSLWKQVSEKFGDYAYFIEEDFLIAPLNPENPSDDWRMNHCCNANCGVRGQISFVALRDINVNEELTFDYAMTESDSDYKIQLHCRYDICRGEFTGNDWKNKDLQKKYSGYFSLYIQEKINKQSNHQ